MSETLKLTIKSNDNKNQPDVFINGWKLGRGVLSTRLTMDAGEKPLFEILCHPDELDIDADILAKLIN